MKPFIVTLLALFSIVSSRAADSSPADLRKAALAVVAPLPDKMPGADKDTPELVGLGKKLFNDNRLSANRSQSCNTCHRVDEQRGGVDNEQFSPGAFGKRGGRNAPTVLNAGFHFAQFWDGRAATLEDQAKGPVLNPVEMAMPNPELVIHRLKESKDYPPLFARAFSGTADTITYDNVAKAIAAFERTLITHDRFDDFLKGDDKALTAKELKGLNLMLTTGCTSCHNGPLLGATTFQKVGLVNPYANTKDVGRMEVSKDEDDKFKFKVPSLRNIVLTAPYFHDGGAADLSNATKQMAHLQLGKDLTDEETDAIVAFFHSLTDKSRAKAAK